MTNRKHKVIWYKNKTKFHHNIWELSKISKSVIFWLFFSFFKLVECERFLVHRTVEKYRKSIYVYTNNESRCSCINIKEMDFKVKIITKNSEVWKYSFELNLQEPNKIP